ncbi:hypothetical protein BDN70DRAFT_74912 [Pholiota conissans]|uniref:Clr5 domain-containing protein n=1 Tax=Pholiota conissans TaxID=109636 RepID=A0A9P5YYA2_9AGAR|nr:hypothetical protein BDN70DRAFT_74912 [Pholiota conissans]
MPNQHKPLPPEDDIKESFKFYYGLGINDKKIALHMRDHYDTERYGLSVRSVKRLRDKWELKSTRQQKHTLESIGEAIQDVRRQYPSRGADMIRRDLLVKLNMRVPRPLIQRYLHETEPHAVQARKQRRFKRRRFYAAGVNDVWAQDQHDKWGPRFGLWLHNNIDPFISFNNWLKVWWTNKNPRLITRYFLNTVREFGAIPVTTQSDPGSENYGVANVQTVIRQTLDPSLKGTLQHHWMRKKNNVKYEANWSVFRRDFAPGYEDLFESGVVARYYDVVHLMLNQIFPPIARTYSRIWKLF